MLPTIADIALGISILEAQLTRVDRQHAAYCLSKMAVGFNERRTNAEAQIVLETWLEVAGDVPNDLWSSATVELLQTWSRDKHYGRMPEPSDFRAVVSAQMQRRQNELARSRLMLQASTATAEANVEKPIETRLGRLEHTRAIYARMNRRFDVDRMDREIAKEKGEPIPEPTVIAGESEREESPPFAPGVSRSDLRCAELARKRYVSAASGLTLSSEPVDFESHELV